VRHPFHGETPLSLKLPPLWIIGNRDGREVSDMGQLQISRFPVISKNNLRKGHTRKY